MTSALPCNLAALAALNSAKQKESMEGSPSVPKDLLKLKEISEKLNLTTRRPSVIQWKKDIEKRKSLGQYLTPTNNQEATSTNHENESGNTESEDNNQVEVDGQHFNEKSTDDNRLSSNSSLHSSKGSCASGSGDRSRRSAQVAIPHITLNNLENYIKTGDDNPAKSLERTQQLSRDSQALQTSNITIASTAPATKDNIASRYRNINQCFEQIRRDLMLMRIEDNKLARKLLNIRSEMNVVRAQCSWQEHAFMLDDVTFELEEEEELTGLIKACDLSNGKPGSLMSNFSPLKNIGVSRMNLNSRRFSIR